MDHSVAKNFNKALEGEISAVEAYEIALAEMEADDPARKQLLEELLTVHKKACDDLRSFLQNAEEKPVEDSGWWGDVTSATEKLVVKLSDKLAIETLKRGEQMGLSMYEWFLKGGKLSPEEKELLNKQSEVQRSNIGKLDALTTSTLPG